MHTENLGLALLVIAGAFLLLSAFCFWIQRRERNKLINRFNERLCESHSPELGGTETLHQGDPAYSDTGGLRDALGAGHQEFQLPDNLRLGRTIAISFLVVSIVSAVAAFIVG